MFLGTLKALEMVSCAAPETIGARVCETDTENRSLLSHGNDQSREDKRLRLLPLQDMMQGRKMCKTRRRVNYFRSEFPESARPYNRSCYITQNAERRDLAVQTNS